MLAPLILLVLVAYWLVLAALALPLVVLDAVFGWTRSRDGDETEPSVDLVVGNDEFPFDRRSDVSKLFGCNTRNVRYRWTIFAEAMRQLQSGTSSLAALDFGAGSLRDSFELSRLNFKVTALDLDHEKMRRQAASYDWSAAGRSAELLTGSVEQLRNRQFDLITAFDVIEHTENAANLIGELRNCLSPNGLMFVSVPNGRSLYEKYGRLELFVKRKVRLKWTPGVPHLIFHTPKEWTALFEQEGFRVVKHDMAIGFVVNDLCHTALKVPLLWVVAPVLDRLCGVFGIKLDREAFVRRFFPRWMAERLDLLDRALKPLTLGLFGWNLFVLERSR